jgi:hypothetical protein
MQVSLNKNSSNFQNKNQNDERQDKDNIQRHPTNPHSNPKSTNKQRLSSFHLETFLPEGQIRVVHLHGWKKKKKKKKKKVKVKKSGG